MEGLDFIQEKRKLSGKILLKQRRVWRFVPTHLGWLAGLYCLEKSISKLPNLSASSSNWSHESIESKAECGDSTFIRLDS